MLNILPSEHHASFSLAAYAEKPDTGGGALAAGNIGVGSQSRQVAARAHHDSTILLVGDATVSVSNRHRFDTSRGTRLTRFYYHVTLASLRRIARLVEDAQHELIPLLIKSDLSFCILFTF
jgi:hypothetical protein